jgi:hypothetical protein
MYEIRANTYAEDTQRGALVSPETEAIVTALLAVAFEQRTANLLANLEAGFMMPGEVPELVAEIRARLGQVNP